MTRTEKGEPLYCPYEGSKWSGQLVNTDTQGQCEHAGKCRQAIPCAWDDSEPGEKAEKDGKP